MQDSLHAGLDHRVPLRQAALALGYKSESYLRQLLQDRDRPAHARRFPDERHRMVPAGFYKRGNKWLISKRALTEHLNKEGRSS
jgi:hypothetical protein